MKISDHSLQQINETYIRSLNEENVRQLCVKIVDDLKDARERLNQNSQNSSLPPSSDSPFGVGGLSDKNKPHPEEEDLSEEEREEENPPQTSEISQETSELSAAPSPEAKEPPVESSSPPKSGKRGKPQGAPGYGRSEVLCTPHTVIHSPTHCAGCGKEFESTHPEQLYTGFQQIDVALKSSETPGIILEVTNHRYAQRSCSCGHVTQEAPATGLVPLEFKDIELSEWRLVGPGLASLIVALHNRYRMSYARIQEFLHDWVGVTLSTGTLCQTVLEAGVAVAPAEEELLQAVRESELLHVDETPWYQQGSTVTLWLWVFATAQVKLFVIAGRGRGLLEKLLGEFFHGFLMSDGWMAYRHLMNRLRCWAHLLRKAKGLKECLDAEGRLFGVLVAETLQTLMDAVYAAREGPPGGVDLPRQFAELLSQLKAECEKMRSSPHKKTCELAGEFLNDWDAIFLVLSHPELPLTNNEAERALRHWVIMRKISYGTRSPVGSRLFAILASVIDTCRLRGDSPWLYLRNAIRARRMGMCTPQLLRGM